MHQAFVVILIQVLVVFNSIAQRKEHLDSLNAIAKSYGCREKIKADSISEYVITIAQQNNHYLALATALKNKAQNQGCGGDFSVGIPNFKKAIALFKKYNDPKGEAATYNNLTTVHRNLSQLDSANLYNKLQLEIALEIRDSVLLMAAYQSKSSIHAVLGENDSIIFYAIKALEIAELTKDKRFEGILLISIGNGYYQNEDYAHALNYYTKAKEIFIASNHSVNLNLLYHNIAVCNTKLNQLDSAFSYFEKAIHLSKQLGNNFNLAYNYQGMADAFFNKGDYEKAIEYNLLSRDISLSLNEKRSLATVLSNLAACYTKTNRPKTAIQYASQAVEIDKEIGDMDKEADAYWLLSEAHMKDGNYKAAFDAFKNFYSIDSTLLNKEKSATIFELETKYKTEKKDMEIASLSQQAAIKDLEIKQKNQAILIGLIGVLFVSAFTYFIYRQRSLQNKEKQTALEQRFLRSQLNPHFIANALMAIQTFMLKNQGDKAAVYLAKFSKLMREILENSRQEFIRVEDEIQMLTNYLDIHRVRLNESFDYIIEVDDTIDVETDAIPPMFVQPFIENAIEHGIAKAKTRGQIKLKLSKEGEYISIEITDNGGGLIQDKQSIKEHTSLSTTIIQERMALFNKSLKKKIKLVLGNILDESGEVNGTKVELKVPYSYL